VIIRRVTIDIAEACEVRELQRELLQIALNQEENIHVRSQAADALVKVGDAKTRKCLKSLAFGLAGDDPEDELKGAALRALWPEHLSAAELFEILTIPKRQNLFGSYRYFLQYDLIAGLRPIDLPIALTWVESLLRGRELDYYLRQFVDAILRRACELLDEPGVIESFARVALALLKEDHPIFESEVFESEDRDSVANPLEDDEIRRKVLSAILPLVENQAGDPWQLESLVKNQDMPWLIRQFKHDDPTQLRQLWAELIVVAFRFVPDQINLVLDACEDEPLLVEKFRWLREPILLNSEEAAEQLKRHQRDLAHRQKRHREPLDPPPAHRIAMQLAASESGNASAWVGLCFDLTLKEDNKYHRWPTADLRRTPGWEQADATTRGCIIAAARRYLLEAQPNPKALLSSGPFRTGDIAGYPALRLLLQEDPSFLQDADEEFWGKWTLLVLDPHHSDEDKNAHEQLLRVAYQRAPQSILAGLGQLIDKESSGPVYIVNEVKAIWDDDIAETILDRVKNPGLSAQGLEKLLGVLLEHGSPDAQLFAASLIATPITTSGEERERALIAGETLFRYARDHGWSAVWGAIQADPAFGRDLMLCISSSSAGIQRLTDDQAADLFAWLTQQFPRTEDPEPPDEVHGVIPRLDLARFRDGIVRQLKERGTPAACRAIARLVAQFPDQPWLKWTLREAEALARQRTWPPPIPAEVLAIATDSNKRLVRSGDELLDVIIESIKRLEEKLHGVTPLVRFLWNELGSTCRPKDENDFSDFVKAHLETDLKEGGIVANREVEVSRPKGAGIGNRTDILVSSVAKGEARDTFQSIHVVIECKGSWNNKLLTDMKDQLRDRYLIDNDHRHGLYLVGYFDSPRWDERDGRRAQSQRHTMDQLQNVLDQQTKKLSNEAQRLRAFVMDIRRA
jgi:hypothetical protein